MKKYVILLALVCVQTLFRTCYAQLDTIPAFAPTREGVEQMLTFVLNASEEEQRMLTDSLIPTEADYEAVFFPLYRKKVYKFHKRLRRIADIYVHPLLEDQTEYVLWSATTEDLQAYSGEARYFPGGYREFAPYFKPALTFYRFKFIQPGMKLGSAYDILVFVNGKWRLFHRPWAVLIDN